jgi:aryl-alcohol dehydrogenase-like predicted oxidoreductase
MGNFSKIALGTVQFGLDYGVSNELGKPDKSAVQEILDFALENNITTLDTASAYGDSESVLGDYGIDNFQIVTKFLPLDIEKGIENSLQESLTKLQTKAVYGYLAHRADSIDVNTWSSLNDLKESGQVKKIGFSLQSVDEFDRMKKKGFIPDLIQVPFNLFDNRFKALCIDLKKDGVEIHTRSTFLQGLFFLKPNELEAFEEVKHIILNLQKTHKEQLAQHLLIYVLQQDYIDKVVIGVQSKKQLAQNICALEVSKEIKDINMTFSEIILNPALWPKT